VTTEATVGEAVRIAAVGDLHVTRDARGKLQPLFSHVSARADVLLLCGDLTDFGLADEADVLVKELAAVGKVPVIAVLGNHDFESNQQSEVRRVLQDGGVTVLDGESCEVHGIGFAGAKGFMGGFGRRSLEPWGEPAVKDLVRESVSEALKLESALARLRTQERVAMLHYAPIAATVEGEPKEIFPYLGSSRLEEPLDRFRVTTVFHGHAHHGQLEGHTRGGAAVYNVALPLLASQFPDQPPVRILELSVARRAPSVQATATA
jgi:Icc-related predicted phosphoesterase